MATSCVRPEGVPFFFLHGGVYASQLGRQVCADSRKVMEKDRTAASEVPAEPSWRSSSRRFAKRRKRNLLRATHRLPVESFAPGVRFLQHGASLLSTVGSAGRVPATMEGVPKGVRPTQRDRLELAEFGRDDDQGIPRGGKRQGKTRPIAANWESSVPLSPIVEAYHWASRLPARMSTIRNWWPSLWRPSRWIAPAHDEAASSTCAWIRGIRAHQFDGSYNAGVTYSTCQRVTAIPPFVAKAAAPDAGLSNAHIVGPTALDACSCGGKRKPSITWDSYIYSSPTPH